MILTPFNYFEWQPKMTLLLSKGLYRITMDTKKDLKSVLEMARFFNKMEKTYGILYLKM